MTIIPQKMRGKPAKCAIVRFLCNIGMYMYHLKLEYQKLKVYTVNAIATTEN